MKLFTKTPQQSLSTDLLRFRPKESDFDRFKNELTLLHGKIDEAKREDNQENHIRDFLLNGFYKGVSAINKKDTIDLVIHLESADSSRVGVIVETKSG